MNLNKNDQHDRPLFYIVAGEVSGDIIGAGVMGISIAHALKRKIPTAKILIIEKENDIYHEYALEKGIHSISGDKDDVLSRLIKCGKKIS